MKKLVSLFLVLVTLLSMVAPVAAESLTETIYLSETMTEQEFRDYAQENAIFNYSDIQSFNGTELHEKGYYYTFIPTTTDNVIQLGYLIADSGYSWKKSASLKREAWVSNGYMDLDFMLGVVYNSNEYQQKLDYYSKRIFAGMWACRYDNPAAFDRCNNAVTIDLAVSVNQSTGKVTNFDVYAVMEDHAYYQDSLVSARDNEVNQIVAEANKKSSQFEAVLYIHDYLVNTAEYDYREYALNSAYSYREEFFFAHSSFGVLNRNLGVCESYSKAFKIICDKLNNAPDCALIISNTHMWNIVQLNGKWYCLDATWDDEGDGKISDTYFLCGDPDVVDEERTDHVPVTKFDFVPQYASSRYHNHTTRYVAQVNATTTTTGVSAHYRCDGCGMYFIDSAAKYRRTLEQLTIAKLTHSLKYVPQVNATETATGTREHYKCTDCGKLFTDATGDVETTLANLTIPKLQHTHSLKSVAQVNATETATGVKAHYKCTGCGKLFTDSQGKNETTLSALTIPKLQHTHSLKYVAQINATETATGVKAHYKCSSCGKLFTDSQGKNETTLKSLTIPALGITVSKPTVSAENTSSGVKISWKAVSKAEKYYVYRRTSSKNAWKKVKTTTSTEYVDTTAASGSQYQYAVRAVRQSVISGYSNTATIKFLATTKATAKNAITGVTVSWRKVTGASGYTLYRRQKTSSGWSSWKNLGNQKSLSYTDKTAVVGKDYQYAAVPYSGNYKAYRYAGSTVRRLKVTSVKTVAEGNYLKTSWSKVSGAKDYVVYRSQLSGKKWSSWKAVATTTKTSYTDKSVKSGVTYKYQVCARYSSSKSAYKVGSSIKMLRVPQVTVTAGTKSIAAKWSKITGASGYTVYRRQMTASGWSSWKNMGNQKSLTYTDKKVTVGVQYQYAVKAYSGSMKSDLKASAVACILATPKATIANKAGGIQVSWKKITGAEGYAVYRSYLKSGKWTGWKKVATATGVSALDKTVSSGTTYRYYVQAVLDANKSSYKASSSLKYLATPTVKATAGDMQITVTWNKITGASGYTVYRRQMTSSGWSSWKSLASQKSLTYTDKKITADTQYQYTVKAYSGSVKSDAKSSATVATMAVPKVTVENSLDAIIAKWSKITGATGYQVYRRELSGSSWSSWKQLAVTIELSYTDAAFENGKTYQYAARAVKGDLVSGYTASASIMFVEAPGDVLPPLETSVYWEKVEGATAYHIYRRTWDEGKPSTDWKKIGEAGAEDTDYDDTTAQSGNMYQYGVCAVKGTSISALREGGAYYYLAKPEFRLFSINGAVNIHITSVNGVTNYVVYKHDGSSWKKIVIGNRTNYMDTDVVVGKTYLYYVQGQRSNMNTEPSVIQSIKVQ